MSRWVVLADRFVRGSGVSIDPNGKLHGVSVNSGPAVGLQELSATIPNRQIGVTTVAAIEALSGMVIPAPTLNNPHHCLLHGITPREAEQLFTPTVANPNVP